MRAGMLGLFVGGALALGVGTAAMASAAGPHAKPAAKAPASTKASPTKSTSSKAAATNTAATTTVSSLGATCSENSFFSGSPAAGSTVNPGDTVSVLYFDESEINPGGGQGKNGVTALAPTFLVNGKATSTPVNVGTLFAKGATSDGFTGLDKYNHVLTVKVPMDATGTIGIIAFDGDQNKTGGDCGVISWTVAAPKTPAPDLTVVKSNDANNDGNFSSTETAPAPKASVTFKVQIINPNDQALTIDTITDSYPGLASPLDECSSLIKTSIDPNSSVTCTFEIADYAPAAGTSLTNTITVTGHNAGGSVTRTDTSTVNTPPPGNPKSPDLAIIKVASLPTVKVGSTLVYSLAVSNVGGGPTTGAVKVTDTVPSGLTITNVTGGGTWNCSTSGRDVACDYLGGVIQAGQNAIGLIEITTQVESNAPTVLINTGVVDTPGDNNPLNDQSTVKTPVVKVLGNKTVKPPATPAVLPFTGAKHTGLLVELAMLLLTLGLGLVIAGTSRRRSPALTA